VIELAARAPRAARRLVLARARQRRPLEQTWSPTRTTPLIMEGEKAPFLAFADQVNRDLDACGFPLCKGDIMARNPRWCLTLPEWRRAFDDWIRNTDPEALMHAAIFFDFRPLGGERAWRASCAMRCSRRPGRTARSAARWRRPRCRRGRRSGCSRFLGDELDLKLAGTRPFVDAARVLALGGGSPETGTAARLQAVNEATRWRPSTTCRPCACGAKQSRARRRAERHRAPRAEGRVPPGDPAAAAPRARLRAMSWFRRTPLEGARWVVIDCETSGLDAARDRLLSVGAVRARWRRGAAGFFQQGSAGHSERAEKHRDPRHRRGRAARAAEPSRE
jgi:hypothetical protein